MDVIGEVRIAVAITSVVDMIIDASVYYMDSCHLPGKAVVDIKGAVSTNTHRNQK